MHIVALTEIAPPLDAALAPLAALLESSAYDLRLVLNAGLPAVVLVTDDRARATQAVTEIRKGGTAPSRVSGPGSRRARR